MFELKEPWKLIGALLILIVVLLVIIFLQTNIDRPQTNTQPIVQYIVKQETVHDTVWKNNSFSIKPSKSFGFRMIEEIHSKRTDEIVFYIEPNVIQNNVNKSGGKLTENFTKSDNMCEILKKVIICTYGYKDEEGNYQEFYKEFPTDNFYLITTATDVSYDGLTTTGPVNWN